MATLRTAPATGQAKLSEGAAISAKIGGDPGALHPHLVAAALGAFIQASVEWWMQSDRLISPRQVMLTAFEHMGRIAEASPPASGGLARLAEAPEI
jgi:hypothetical protein